MKPTTLDISAYAKSSEPMLLNFCRNRETNTEISFKVTKKKKKNNTPAIFEMIISYASLVMSSIFIASSIITLLFSSGFPRAACGSLTESAALGNETDRQALLAFKNQLTADPLGALRSWNHSVHFCQWVGVTCGRRHQRVVVLNLDNQLLKGPISPHIGNLSFLRTLLLNNNSLEQQIPPEIGRLRRLQTIMLANNSIGGEIPVNLTGCSNLLLLRLTRNTLEGVIPAEIGNSLSNLEELYLGVNHLTGVLPSTLANLSSLLYLYAPRNNIHGSIPSQFGRFKVLEDFVAQENNLVGTIPASMFNISSIQLWDLSVNQLRGSLPSQLGGTIFPSLGYLGLDSNLFHGNIPVSISNASNLRSLGLGLNKFTGAVPSMEMLKNLRFINLQVNYLGTAGRDEDLSFLSSLTNITTIKDIVLDHNNFGGELPRSIGNFSRSSYLSTMVLHYNEISGSIPDGIGNLIGLQILLLGNNRLTGNIPFTIGKLTELRLLVIAGNKLNGTIPTSFRNVSFLLKLYLYENRLSGEIPSGLGNCTNLLVFSLYSNNLHGTIPREVFSISSLTELDLHQNHFTGSLPMEIGSLITLELLSFHDNLLSGEVPTTLASCVQLDTLDMGINHFQGTIPSSLSFLRALQFLDLSRNNFSGKVPDYLAGFIFLQSLNLSFNDFEGTVPERGIFKNTTALDVKGNIKLCGGVPQLHLPLCNSKVPKKYSNNLKVKFLVCLAVGVIAVVLLLGFFYLYLSKKSPSVPHPENSFLNLSYQTLLEATNRFSPANLIRVGSFGSVYKGLLDQGQKIVAVKVLNLLRPGATRSFMAECEALRRIRHRNLVKVLTVCSSIDHQGNDFKALVYEYMANGSLDDWLHSYESQIEIEDVDSGNLNISQRLDIAIDVASALEYLHHGCEEPIVHCDLKPSNILLDEDMVGHVGDFGLAKFLQPSGSQSSSIGLRGSVGYVAPEYGVGNEVSTSGDVYCYGILLLEMFTGKRPTNNQMFKDCLNLHDYVKESLPEQVAEVSDSRLLIHTTLQEVESTRRSNAQNLEFTSIEGCLVSVLEVGIACSREVPGDRMTISGAIVQLRAIKKALLGTTNGGGRLPVRS